MPDPYHKHANEVKQQFSNSGVALYRNFYSQAEGGCIQFPSIENAGGGQTCTSRQVLNGQSSHQQMIRKNDSIFSAMQETKPNDMQMSSVKRKFNSVAPTTQASSQQMSKNLPKKSPMSLHSGALTIKETSSNRQQAKLPAAT